MRVSKYKTVLTIIAPIPRSVAAHAKAPGPALSEARNPLRPICCGVSQRRSPTVFVR